MVTTQHKTRKILIVEDDRDTAEVMTILLDDAGFSPKPVHMGHVALLQLKMDTPDLILLDLNLPDMHGLEVLAKIRQKSSVPMIVISGYYNQEDKVAALEAGADDFLAKPFSPEELLARVRAILRRVEWSPEPQSTLIVRELELDIALRQVTVRNERMHLTPIEYGLLLALMQNVGETVTHDVLLSAVWGNNYQGDYSVLRVNISRLRQKLEKNPRIPRYIVTVAGQGYVMPRD